MQPVSQNKVLYNFEFEGDIDLQWVKILYLQSS